MSASVSANTISPSSNRSTVLSIFVILLLCIVIITVTVVLFIKYGLFIPASAPSYIRFAETTDAKLIGVPKLDTLNNITLDACIDTCDKDNVCMSLSYAPDQRMCLTYAMNTNVDPTLLKTDTKGWNYYEKRNFWSRFGPSMTGSFNDYGALNQTEENVSSTRDCAVKCINKSETPKCMGFNYYGNTSKCNLVGIPYKGNASNLDSNDTSSVYYELLFRDAPKDTSSDTSSDAKSASTPILSNAGKTTVPSSAQSVSENFVSFPTRTQNKRVWSIMIVLLIGLFVFNK